MDSPERLIKAAHEVLLESGLAGFKVLDVAARASANVALINYHFGGRDGLLDEVVRRSTARVTQLRSKRLATLLEASGAGLPDPHEVLHCWIDPWIETIERGNNREIMMVLLHVMYGADVPRERKERLLAGTVEVTGHFVEVLSRCYPEVPRSSMTWRMLCAIGATYQVLGQREPIGWSMLGGEQQRGVRPRNSEATAQLVAFILGGFAAPPDTGYPPKEGLTSLSRKS